MDYDLMASEAESFENELNRLAAPDHDLIRHGLQHKYDVIVSSALDYIRDNSLVDEFAGEVCAVAYEQSYLIRTRILLCAAHSTKDELESLVKIIKLRFQGNIERPYALYYDVVGRRDKEALKKLKSLIGNHDKGISSISRRLYFDAMKLLRDRKS